MNQELITKIHNISFFTSPWDNTKLAAYIVCETDIGRKIMILFKEVTNELIFSYNKPIYEESGYILWHQKTSEFELVFNGQTVKEICTIFDLDTGEGLNGKN